jgi:hypothetical protein
MLEFRADPQSPYHNKSFSKDKKLGHAEKYQRHDEEPNSIGEPIEPAAFLQLEAGERPAPIDITCLCRHRSL